MKEQTEKQIKTENSADQNNCNTNTCCMQTQGHDCQHGVLKCPICGQSPCKCKKKMFKILFAIALLILGYYLFAKLKSDDVITVSGTSRTTVNNQIARFTSNVIVQDKVKDTAVTMVTQKSSAVVDAIKKFGITSENIKTNSVSIYQLQDYYMENGVQKYRPGNWNATISIEIKLQDVNKASEFATLLAGLETTDIFGPDLTVDMAKLDEGVYLAKAVEDAKSKASKIATAAGKKLGSVKLINENGSGYINPTPMYEAKFGMGGAGSSIPVEAGSTEVVRSVTVTFYLK